MTWYAAHLLFYVKLRGKRQARFPAWENIVLIHARSEKEAFIKAEKRAADDACMQPDDTFTWNGAPAKWVFAGVRKLTLCMDEHKRPGDGAEVSYTELVFSSEKAVRQFAAGEPVSARIEGGFADEPDAEPVHARRLAE